VVELLEHAAHVATDPKRVYYLGAGGNSPQCAQGLLSMPLPRPASDRGRAGASQHARRS